ncbi:MAG: FmdB family zinc ribbon protein [Gemmataceae bacterium]
MYEYACEECSHTFETLVFHGDKVECPECHSNQLERLLSVPAKPHVQGSSLPTACNTDLPPCGPGCCRL